MTVGQQRKDYQARLSKIKVLALKKNAKNIEITMSEVLRDVIKKLPKYKARLILGPARSWGGIKVGDLPLPMLNKFHSVSIYLQNKFSRRLWRKISCGLGLFLGTLILVVGNWKLLLATNAGVGIMFMVYHWHEEKCAQFWLQCRKLLLSSNGKFTVAVGCGGIAAVITYMVAAIWADMENRWLAAGTILQGLISVTTLGLLGWQIFSQQFNQDEVKFEELLIGLTATSSLKRLMAVRHLSDLVEDRDLNSRKKEQIEEYFQLMLKVESEPIIRQVLQESLCLWHSSQPLATINSPSNHQPLKIPVSYQKLKDKVL